MCQYLALGGLKNLAKLRLNPVNSCMKVVQVDHILSYGQVNSFNSCDAWFLWPET